MKRHSNWPRRLGNIAVALLRDLCIRGNRINLFEECRAEIRYRALLLLALNSRCDNRLFKDPPLRRKRVVSLLIPVEFLRQLHAINAYATRLGGQVAASLPPADRLVRSRMQRQQKTRCTRSMQSVALKAGPRLQPRLKHLQPG